MAVAVVIVNSDQAEIFITPGSALLGPGRGPGRVNAPNRALEPLSTKTGRFLADPPPQPGRDRLQANFPMPSNTKKTPFPPLRPVEPILPVAPYIGGKKNLAKRLCALIEATPHTLYAEPFVGMGGIFLRRAMRPKAEVINDRSGEVSNLFRIAREHYPQFLQVIQFQITSRAEFERLVKVDPSTLTDLQRAARFLYMQRTTFGGKVAGSPTFGVDPSRPARFDISKVGPMLEELYVRLQGVSIENLDFEAFLTRYDRPGALFYLDPPYWGSEGDYGKALFSRADFERLRGVLARLEGSFILSINDVPEIRALFADFHIQPVETTYTVSRGKGKKVGELIISNRALSAAGRR